MASGLYRQTFAITLFVLVVIRDTTSAPCYRNTTTCIPVTSTTCLTTKITFTHTSTEFVNGTLSLAEIDRELEVWSLLRGVPECWAVVQPYLCSVYQPRCDAGNQKVEQPNRELCERVREPCKVVTKYNGSWPWFLQCDQEFYAESCGQTFYEQASFDTTGQCSAPLIATSDETNWFDTIHGCGVQCKNPMYTEGEHNAAHIFVAIMCALCLLSSVFTLVTFIIDWKVGRKYPAVILFFISICFILACCGWLAQFIDRQDIVCRKDGTVRQGEPMIGSGETASCTVVFILVYYFMLAGVVWFVMLTYSWDITFKAIGTVRDDLSRKTAYFHITCWCLPLVLTIVVLSVSEIDGDSVSGICFPGYESSWARTGFVLAPICVVLTIGTVFCSRGLITLIRVQKDTPPFISDKATAKIKETIIRLIVFIILAFTLVFISVGTHIYNFASKQTWEDSLEDYIYCKANVSVMGILNNKTSDVCELESRPSIVAALLHIFAFFATGIAMSSWTWNSSTLEVWQHVYRRLCRKPEIKPTRMRHRRIVARSFKRRKKRNNERLSISYGTEHDDPLGMKFDRSSMSSQSLSSGFAVAMPKHGRHRGKLVRPGTGVIRRYSDSDLASQHSRHSGRRMSSRSSRKESYESSMSQKLSDIEREIRREERRKRRVKRRKKRQNRIQPILEPISSRLAALQAQRLRHERDMRRISDSSDGSKTSAGAVNLALAEMNRHNLPVDSSTFLSDSVMTGNSISELELPQQYNHHNPHHHHHIPDFSMFTANTMLPPTENRGDNSNGQPNNLKKGANPSPSGSFRRGRRREVKLEMTETSFYQEDEDNIEMGGNQTIHREENCQESGEIRQNLKEFGPLVNEIFERARANSGSGRSSVNGRNSYQRDPMGSSRLGSASSRGSRGSRGSQTNPKEQLRYANTKVTLPDRPSHEPGARGRNRRPFSGDYVLVGRRNEVCGDGEVRKSRSQPTSATSHKRQIGHNGRLGIEDGLNWSRYLQGKGQTESEIFTKPQYYFKGKKTGPLAIMDKSHFMNQNDQPETAIDVLNVEQERVCGCDSNTESEVNVLNVEDEHKHGFRGDKGQEVNILNIEREQMFNTGLAGDRRRGKGHRGHHVDVLDLEEERHRQLQEMTDNGYHGYQYYPGRNLSHVNFSDEEKQIMKQKQKSSNKYSGPNDKHKNVNVLNVDEERRRMTSRAKESVNKDSKLHNKTKTVDPRHMNSVAENVDMKNVNKNQKCSNETKSNRKIDKPSKENSVCENGAVNNLIKVCEDVHCGKKQNVSSHNAQHQNVSSHNAQLQNVFSHNAHPQDLSSHNAQIQNVSSHNAQLQNVSSHNAQPQNVSSHNAQLQQPSTEKNKQEKTSSKKISKDKTEQNSAQIVLKVNNDPGSFQRDDRRHRSYRQRGLDARYGGYPRYTQYGSASTLSSGYDPRLDESTIVPGNEGKANLLNLVDYELESEYDDFTDDLLTDTYTYTSYDDDLTEVSSLPC